MAAKRNALERTLEKARSLLSSYVTPGRKSAEATLEELLRMLRQARGVVARERKRIGSSGPRRRKRSSQSAAPTRKRSGAGRKRRSAAATGRAERRTTSGQQGKTRPKSTRRPAKARKAHKRS
jgi:hypothetical protein